jgi:uncharacterized phiE125 gp8 family phage protein
MRNLQTRVITDIVTEPVSVAEAKLYCKVQDMADDALFPVLITSARRMLEKYTMTSFAEKTLHATWVEVPRTNYVELPYGPVISIDHIYRIDHEGNEEELVLNSDYYVMGDQDAIIKITSYWSSGMVYVNSIRCEYKAGYGNAATETLPQELKLAILKQVATDYELRENIVQGITTVLSNESKILANPYRKKLWI